MGRMVGVDRGGVLATVATLLVSILLLISWGPSSASPSSQAVVNVSMVDNGFRPQNLTVMAGVQVVWTNNGTVPHTGTADGELWDSGALAPGEAFSRVFDAPGRYPYHCDYHRGGGMVGIIVVQGTAQPTATPTRSLTPVPGLATGGPTAAPPGTPSPGATPAPAKPQATPGAPTAVPSPAPGVPATLPATGGTESLPQWAIALAGLAAVVGGAARMAARR